MEDDRTLLDRYRRDSDTEAFAELAGRYAGFVYATAYRVTGSVQDAEDVAQDCFLALLRHEGEAPRSFPAWLHRVAVNRSVSLLRSASRRRRREQAVAAAPEPPTAGAAEWSDIAPHIDSAVEELPEELRKPILLHFLRGRTQEDIARETDVDPSTVSRRIQRGLDRLHASLKRAGIIAPVAVLGALIAANASQAAPAGLEACLSKALANYTARSTGAKLFGVSVAKVISVLACCAVLIGAGSLAVRATGEKSAPGSTTASPMPVAEIPKPAPPDETAARRRALQRLVDALWADLPSKVEVTALKTLTRRPPSRESVEASIRRSFENETAATGRPADEQLIQDNVQHILDGYKRPQLAKEHVTLSGKTMQIERCTVFDFIDTDRPWENVYANIADESGRVVSSYHIDHKRKMVWRAAGSWSAPKEYLGLGTVSEGGRILLKLYFGRVEGEGDGRKFVLDQEKLEACAVGEHPTVSCDIRPGEPVDGTATTVVELRLKPRPSVFTRWVLDASEYRVCFREETYSGKLDEPVTAWTAADFRPADDVATTYPRRASFRKMDPKTGELVKSAEYRILNVSLAPEFAADAFDLKPPKGYRDAADANKVY